MELKTISMMVTMTIWMMISLMRTMKHTTPLKLGPHAASGALLACSGAGRRA
jgi:hypothetical protein